ncbi:MAG: hypothetical protein U9N59_07085 [Campylobacterota bacterium]|nr:hypothetical protein [Campylobacterota bacterium]
MNYEELTPQLKSEVQEALNNNRLQMSCKDLYENIKQSNGNHEIIAQSFNVPNVLAFKIQELSKI